MDRCQLAEPFASGTVISNDTYREFVVPSSQKTFELFRSQKVPTMLHIGGDSALIPKGAMEANPEILRMDRRIDTGATRAASGESYSTQVMWTPSPRYETGRHNKCWRHRNGVSNSRARTVISYRHQHVGWPRMHR